MSDPTPRPTTPSTPGPQGVAARPDAASGKVVEPRWLAGVPRVPMVVVAVAAGLAAVVLALLWIGVVDDWGLARADPGVVAGLAAARPEWAVAVMAVVAQIGSPAVMSVVMVAASAVVAWRRRSLAVLAVGCGGLALIAGADQLVKHVVARPRPPLALHAVPAVGYSFPSGHATISAGVVLLALWLTTAPGTIRAASASRHRDGAVRSGVVVLAVVFVVAVGGSRLVLGVHYPSDVLAGWCVAVLAVAAVLGVVAALTTVSTRCGQHMVPGSSPEQASVGPGDPGKLW